MDRVLRILPPAQDAQGHAEGAVLIALYQGRKRIPPAGRDMSEQRLVALVALGHGGLVEQRGGS